MQKELYDLLKIGLTEGEAKVYIALMELGSSTVGPIVKKANVAYSNVYDILDRLIKKGIVTFIIKQKTKYFQAVSPSNLLYYLEKKEEEIKNQKISLKKALPELKKLQENVPNEEAEIFIGKKGLRTAYEKYHENKTKGEVGHFFFIYDKEYAEEADLFYLSAKDIFKKANSTGITNEAGIKSASVESLTKLGINKEVRYVTFPIPGNIEVCGNRLLLVSWKKPIMATLITSQQLADNFREYFDGVWKVAKPIHFKAKPK